MSLLGLKKRVEKLPEIFGRPLARVPFAVRLGPAYSRSRKEIVWYENHSGDERTDLIANRLRRILNFAYAEIPFYRRFYDDRNFHPNALQSIMDWKTVPIVTKTDLQSVPLHQRVSTRHCGMKINTGGTSGSPLEFYIDHHAFAREWAHMHRIWMARGYRPHHIKLTFRGKHFPESEPIRYNAVHNEYVANSNCSVDQIAHSIGRLPKTILIRWIHGYPSLIAEFASHLSQRSGTLLSRIRERLYGVLLGSEYPAPHYRDTIEKVLSTNVVSWYGHSEMALLAGESARGVYTSLPSYGYAEASESGTGGLAHSRLVATSFYNLAHPFIRYDTGDLIEPVGENHDALSFRISDGRIGDFVIGHGGRKIALTALVFGRHHQAFSHLYHLQVRQNQPGSITLLVVPIGNVTAKQLEDGFDLADAGIDWNVEVLDAPIRSAAGKTPLKVS